eukprot:m.23693 g.23693  ORF g.23693 m.23693 type:complete len:533 (+) comp35392_c0_seq1:61-1659(+)
MSGPNSPRGATRFPRDASQLKKEIGTRRATLVRPNTEQWNGLQEIAFTKWINSVLQTNAVTDISKDLHDGLVLIKLAEALTHKPFPSRYNKTPKLISAQNENIALALDFFTKDGVRNISTGPAMINGPEGVGDKKSIVGFIWLLILHYDIHGHRFKGELNFEAAAPANSRASMVANPHQSLNDWLQSMLPSLIGRVDEPSNWQDGTLLTQLVQHMDPTYSENSETGFVHPTQHAVALGVPEILTQTELESAELDQQSLLTYLNGFRVIMTRAASLAPKDMGEGARSKFARNAIAEDDEAAAEDDDDDDEDDFDLESVDDAALPAPTPRMSYSGLEPGSTLVPHDIANLRLPDQLADSLSADRIRVEEGRIICPTESGLKLINLQFANILTANDPKDHSVQVQYFDNEAKAYQDVILKPSSTAEKDRLLTAIQRSVDRLPEHVAGYCTRSVQLDDGIISIYREYQGEKQLQLSSKLTGGKVSKLEQEGNCFISITVLVGNRRCELRVQAPSTEVLDDWVEGVQEEIDFANESA